MTVPKPLRPLLEYLETPDGRRLDGKIIRYSGHSLYSQLYRVETTGEWWPKTYRPPLALTTIGWRSGRLHTVGLAYFDLDGAWAVVGSAGGSETEPHWVRNLRHNPTAWVHLQRRTTPVLGEVLEGEAKRPVWQRFAARAPVFDKFQSGVARDIPIVVLRPRAASPAA
jgi:deazaflavin-dependent oxidoreductase (nitroreductase family)